MSRDKISDHSLAVHYYMYGDSGLVNFSVMEVGVYFYVVFDDKLPRDYTFS